MSEYIHTNKIDTNECENIYVHTKLMIDKCPNIIGQTLLTQTNVRIYLYKPNWHKQMSEFIHTNKIDTKE